jgi:hypothetical protein
MSAGTRSQTVQEGFVMPRVATTIPQAGVKSLYTISGGTIIVLQIFGVVTTTIAGGPKSTKLQAKPTGQTAIDLCAVGDINGLVAGQLVAVVGPPATALAVGWVAQGSSQHWLLPPGTIDLNCAAAAGTGALRSALYTTW